MNIIEVKEVSKSYPEGEGFNQVLTDINLQIKEKEFVALLGKSGSGKTTLMNLIGGLDDFDSGEITIMSKSLKDRNDKEMSKYRRSTVGFVFQTFNLIPVLTVWENIIMPIRLDYKEVEEDYINELLVLLGIYEKRDSIVTKLSGGQQQRVAIARALANKPKLILADEPTGNLDTETGEVVMELLVSGVKKFGQTLLVITHNNDIAKKADRIVYIKDGQICEQGVHSPMW